MTTIHDNGLSKIDDVIADAKAGKLFILVDDEDRENEGDLCVIGEYANADAINFMAKYGRGLICLSLTRQRTEQLGLSMMERRNESRHETAFTVSIEAREGVTTGISAGDRAHTIQTAINPQCTERDIATPGHIFPLVARDGGTLVRAGHTEAVIDIARACGSDNPSGVICEIMKDDGEMARLPDLLEFASEHDLKIASIADLIAWRRRNESLVQRTVETAITTRIGGTWRVVIYANIISNIEHIALVKGDISAGEPVLVRMHGLDLMADLLGEVSEKRAGDELSTAMAAIAKAGRGVVVVLRESSASSLSSMVGQKLAAAADSGGVRELRDYGVGAQILTDLGVVKMIVLSDTRPNVVSLDGYDLEIADWQPIHQEKKIMAGHFLIIEADFYADIAVAQCEGAMKALTAAKASFDRVSVPGALEIPAAIAMAAESGRHYDGYVALGCVIRGETTHYETVCNLSARGLMDLSLVDGLAIGNGILTVENEDQAWARADFKQKDKGGDAARAALAMVALKTTFSELSDD